jgi:predicted O-methyltransferase YrrM
MMVSSDHRAGARVLSLGAWRCQTAGMPDPLRPLAPILPELPAGTALTPEAIATLGTTRPYAEAEAYLWTYPALSFLSGRSRTVLYSLIRLLRPKVVAEVGTLFAGTAEAIARALWENGGGILHTTDPYGADRCPAIIETWPRELQKITRYYPLNSMDFFLALDREGVTLDMALVDGNHDFEFALFDLQMAARLLRPGGTIIMDNAEQSGPFRAARMFMGSNPGWREIGNSLATYDRFKPFDLTRTSIPGTSFIVLKAPDYLSIGPGPHSWGQKYVECSQVQNLVLYLPTQKTAGLLFYQAILRGFADNNRRAEELKADGQIRLETNGEPTAIVHPLAESLSFHDMPADAAFTVDIDLSWQADPGSPCLVLSDIPTAS